MKQFIFGCKRYVLHLVTKQKAFFNLCLSLIYRINNCSKKKKGIKTENMILQNDEQIEDFYIKKNTNIKHGITGIGRLHNSGEYLEIVVRSWLDIFDEILLIDNNSTDNTPQICSKLEKEFPEKIRYLSYPYEIAKPYSKDHSNTSQSSIHSLVYYYNRCFSQASYDIVCKLDDDNLLINEFCDKKKMRSKVLNMSRNSYLCFGGYNIINKSNSYDLLPIIDRYSGLIGDIGFYYNTSERFFYKDLYYEKLNKTGMKWEWLGIIYLHLKYLKTDMKYFGDINTTSFNKRIHNLAKKYLNTSDI